MRAPDSFYYYFLLFIEKKVQSMSVKTVVALILAIPTFGISLGLLIAFKFYQAARSVNSVEKVLIHLGDEGAEERACFNEISYLQAKTFLEEKGDCVSSVNFHYTYLLKRSGGVLLVEVDKEPHGQCAIFRVVNVDWLAGLQRWARAGHLPEKKISLVDLYNLENFSDHPLDSTGDSLVDKEIEELPADFYRLPNIQLLSLGEKSFASLGSNLSKMQSLRVLRVMECDCIPPEVGALRNLEALFFWHGTVEHIPDEIGMLKNLRTLNLKANNISATPQWIGGLEKLRTLDLRENRISSLPDSMTANASINYLLLGDNKLSNLPRLPRIPNRYTSMSTVDLGFNQFHTIPESIFDIDILDKLIMCGNPLRSLPEDLSRLNVKSLLVFGEQKNLKLSQYQVAWLKEKEATGCKIWLDCDDLVMGNVEEWKSRIHIRFF